MRVAQLSSAATDQPQRPVVSQQAVLALQREPPLTEEAVPAPLAEKLERRESPRVGQGVPT